MKQVFPVQYPSPQEFPFVLAQMFSSSLFIILKCLFNEASSSSHVKELQAFLVSFFLRMGFHVSYLQASSSKPSSFVAIEQDNAVTESTGSVEIILCSH